MLFEFNLNYGGQLIVPFADGITLMSALRDAKLYKAPYKEEVTIRDLVKDTITTNVISAQEYGECILRQTLLPKKDPEE